MWLSAQTLFPAEICSRDQIEFGRVRKGQGWSQLQELVTNPASLDSLEYLRPASARYKYSCPRTVVSHQPEVFQSIGCGDYSNALRATRVVGSSQLSALAMSKPRHCGRSDGNHGIDLRGGEFPQDLGRRMTKGNQ